LAAFVWFQRALQQQINGGASNEMIDFAQLGLARSAPAHSTRSNARRPEERMMEISMLRRVNLRVMRLSASAISMSAAFATLAALAALTSLPANAENVASLDPAADPAAAPATAIAAATEMSSPASAVETFHAGLIEIMKEADTLGFQGRIDKLTPLMTKTFDLDFMASKTVGRHWRKLSDADKERWAKTFTRFTTANYAGRFTGYTGEEFVTDGVEEAARGTRVVLTKIVIPDEDDVQLNYRVIERDGKWRVIDVYLNGTVSELALRRSEYSSALKRDGFDQLCSSIETKIADLKSKAQADG
jgi:phospholipid transport system substrate-binding protein